MRLTDYSDLKRQDTIEIPLNGEIYEAVGDPPADDILSVIGLGAEDMGLLARALKDESSLSAEDLAKVSAAGSTRTQQALRFLDHVLFPDSLERWKRYMAAPNPEASPEDQEHHRSRQITLAQCTAVVRDLIKAYSAGRRTTPSSSSANGHDGGGLTSTAGALPAG